MTTTTRSMALLYTAFIFPAPEARPEPPAAEEWFAGWQLEASLAQAELILVARVASVSQVTVVEGAKTNTNLREYRFQPLRRLKGVFSRDELSMTGSDLGCPVDDGTSPPPFREGETRLLILAQQQGSYVGCVAAPSGATSLEQRVPLLSSPDDPIVAMVEALVRVTSARSRRERVAILAAHLEKASGPAAVPLLESLRQRALWAAREPRLTAPILRLASDPSPAIRTAAARAMERLLAADYLKNDPDRLSAFAEVLKKTLESKEALVELRVASLQALGHLAGRGRELGWPGRLLLRELQGARTRAERFAALSALDHLEDPESAPGLLEALRSLPLDEDPGRELAHARPAARLDQKQTIAILKERVEASLAARQALDGEAIELGCLKAAQVLPLLLEGARRFTATADERRAVALVAGGLKSEGGVALLAEWLRSQDFSLREAALAALENIDAKAAAEAVRVWFKSEPSLPFKLRMAKLMGRHGFPDGYSLAVEHLADQDHTRMAAEALRAIRDPRTSGELNALFDESRDRRWSAAALTGLVALGDPGARERLLKILADARHPLLMEAAAAAALSTDERVLPLLAALLESRNQRLAHTALGALRDIAARWLEPRPERLPGCPLLHDEAGPRLRSDAPAALRGPVVPPLRALLADAFVDEGLRLGALDLLSQIEGEGLSSILVELADDADLEGTPLLNQVEEVLRRRRLPLPRDREKTALKG